MEVKIDKALYDRLNYLGLIPNETRNSNVGKSNYSKKTIQPWSIWLDYNLNPWDADIVKRILRTKEEPGMTLEESRLMDYNKIIHICQERIRQINTGNTSTITVELDQPIIALDNTNQPTMFSLLGEELKRYTEFVEQHKGCGGFIQTRIDASGGIGHGITLTCPVCGHEKDITDYSLW